MRTHIILKSHVWVWKGPWFQGSEPPWGSEVQTGPRWPSCPQKLTAGRHESETRRLRCRETSFSTGSGGWELETGVPGGKVGVPVPGVLVATARRTEDTERGVHVTPQRDTTVSHACVRRGLTSPPPRSFPEPSHPGTVCLPEWPLPGSLSAEFPGLQGPVPAQLRGRGSRGVAPARPRGDSGAVVLGDHDSTVF